MKVAPRSFSLIMVRVPAMCSQGEKNGRLLLSLVNTNMNFFVIMLKRYRGRCSLVVILALILFFFQFSSLKSYTIHQYEICLKSKKIGGVTKAVSSLFANICLLPLPPPSLHRIFPMNSFSLICSRKGTNV